ncbi:MAG TPA: DUF4253 domain-containing protein [Trebonia sp.]|jgi:hypothetical protein|nr:DUF4253 domain-containing protein [Trebonia sp.]
MLLSRPWPSRAYAGASTGCPLNVCRYRAGEPGRPYPLDTTAIDPLDAAAILAGYWWADEETLAEDEELRAILAPFGPDFPGLSPAIVGEIDPELMQRALYQYTRDARIGLVPAQRPADVLARLGWMGAVNSRSTADITAVLRSWEDRFGARLIEVGFADLRLLV